MTDTLRNVLYRIPNPSNGLPADVFNFILKVTPVINVDLLVRDAANRVLFSWREDEWGVGWHIPGGIIRFKELYEHRITAVARLELGTTVTAESMPCKILQLLDEGRGHFLSLLFRCRLSGEPGENGLVKMRVNQPRPTDLDWIEGIPDPLYPAHRGYSDWLRSTVDF
jgi:hypothetical protein